MVLQVAADWQIDHRRDVDAAQVLRRADSGKHQELGCVEGTTAKNHLARRFGAHDLAVLRVRQDIGIGPAPRALLRPPVIVARVTAGEHHHVDR
jgi:hypothetical protein